MVRLRTSAALTAALFVAAFALTSCATLSLRPFNPTRHGSVYQEWPPHRNSGEWWYVTGVLHNPQGGLWMYQFTIFHQANGLTQGYLLDLALSDYSTGQHLFEEYATTSSKKAHFRNGRLVFGKSFISLSHHRLAIHAVGKKLSFDFSLIPKKPPVWQADNGIEAMGKSGTPDQMSYYYSFERLATSGRISYLDSKGKRVSDRVHGSSWLDRQWGHFSQSAWDWFSIRLFDGNDVMLYAFPPTGFRQGTLAGPAGHTTSFMNYSYRTERWQRRGKSRYGLEWRVHLPILHATYRIVALSPNDYNPNRVLGYWEGLCKVYNSAGKLVGYAVEETTETAHPVPTGAS